MRHARLLEGGGDGPDLSVLTGQLGRDAVQHLQSRCVDAVVIGDENAHEMGPGLSLCLGNVRAGGKRRGRIAGGRIRIAGTRSRPPTPRAPAIRACGGVQGLAMSSGPWPGSGRGAGLLRARLVRSMPPGLRQERAGCGDPRPGSGASGEFGDEAACFVGGAREPRLVLAGIEAGAGRRGHRLRRQDVDPSGRSARSRRPRSGRARSARPWWSRNGRRTWPPAPPRRRRRRRCRRGRAAAPCRERGGPSRSRWWSTELCQSFCAMWSAGVSGPA